jgi:hypothetical protein
LRKYIQRFSRVQHNIPDFHPTTVISAFHHNVRNHKMREELAMNKIRDIGELYALADKCTCAEEGRKLPGKDAGAGGSSESDGAAPAKKGRWRNNRMRKGKAVLAVEQSGNGGDTKKAKVESSGKEIAACANCQALAAADKQDGSDKQYCKIHHTKGHDLQNCRQVEQLVERQKAEYERRDKEKAPKGAGGSGKKRTARGGCRGNAKQQQKDRPPRGCDKDGDDDDDLDGEESSEHEFQKATEVLCVDGGASLHSSHRQLK